MYNGMSNKKFTEVNYNLVPPDGGWGYVIFISFLIFHLINVTAMNTFGLTYGNFLASVGDETIQIAIVLAIFFITAQTLSGIVVNILLRRFSLRQVGLAGACIYNFGMLCSIFMQTLTQLIICYSILQGFGSGLMTNVIFCSFNSYFSKRLNLMMGIGQVCATAAVMVAPITTALMLENLGFRKTLGLMTGISLLNIVGMALLDPVDKHMKKVLIIEYDEKNDSREGKQPVLYVPIENVDNNTGSLRELNYNNEKLSLLDFSVLKSPKYLNMSFGLAVAFTADVTFDALIPSILSPIGFSTKDIAYFMSVCFGCDLASRILYTITSIFFTFKNRPIFLAASLFMGLLRTVFIFNTSYTWAMTTLGIYGTTRGFLQTTFILVIAENYKENLKSAIPLMLMLCGIVNLTSGGVASLLKMTSNDDKMVVHLLSFENFLCAACWLIEIIFARIKLK